MFITHTFELSIPFDIIRAEESGKQREAMVSYDVFSGTDTWCNPHVSLELSSMLNVIDTLSLTGFVMDAIRSHAKKQLCSQE